MPDILQGLRHCTDEHPCPYKTYVAVRGETGSKQAEGTAYGGTSTFDKN